MFTMVIVLSALVSGQPAHPFAQGLIDKSFPTLAACEAERTSDQMQKAVADLVTQIQEKVNDSKLSADTKCIDVTPKAGEDDGSI